MTELKRVKQYFAKIQKAEEPPAQRTTSVNTEAATRILKADLVSTVIDQRAAQLLLTDIKGSNSKDLKQKLEEKLAEERAKALLNSIQNSKRPAQDDTSAGQGKKQRGGASASNGGSRQKNKKRKA